ncbi:MAG: hypothetical protein Q9187_008293, partial [Circinaria calcarea]
YPMLHGKPQKPFDEVMELPSIPKIPQQHLPAARQTSRRSPPPSFPFSPDQVGRFSAQQPSRPFADWPSPGSKTGQHPSAIYPQAKQYPMVPHHFQQSAYLSAQSARQVPAPYQRTGDPYFTQTPRFPSDHYPSIPPASKLPPPKLTSHTSTLLNIFKSGTSPFSDPKSAGRTTVQSDIINIADRNHVSAPSSAKPYSAGSIPLGENRSEGPPKPLNTESNGAPVVRTQQQDALLNLFRTSPMSNSDTAHKTPTTLEPPSAPIELSAFPSPSHSRVTSEVNQAEVMNISKPVLNGRVAIKKRHEITTPTSAKAPVSATVTGPLNVPQFDRIAKKATGATSGIGAAREPGHSTKPQHITPFRILSRTGAPLKPLQATEITKQPFPKTQPMGPTPVQPPTSTKSQKKESPKIFQPQILRRPAQEHPPLQASPHPLSHLQQPTLQKPSQPPPSLTQSLSRAPASLPVQTHLEPLSPNPSQPSPSVDLFLQTLSPPPPSSPTPLITKDNIMLDRRSGQTLEQKNTLLSLFSKPKTNPHTPVVSPLTERFPPTETGALISSSFSSLPPPGGRPKSRSRIGSGGSVLGDFGSGSGGGGGGGGKPSAGKQATPVDKTVLLSYLDGVLLKEGRK